MKSITSVNNIIVFGQEIYSQLNAYIKDNQPSKLFLLVDEHTQTHCAPYFLQQLETDISIEIIEIEAGEEHKNITTCSGVWQTLSELDADRKSLMLNLGGGVVTDLGGFVASTFKRGISYINIPTTLLAMVDASVGGKTGVDLGNLKNQVGVISNAEMVLIDVGYLATLPQNEMKSGLAEMLKHGLIQDLLYWKKMSDLSQLSITDLEQLIYDSVVIKNNVVKEDINENGIRKTLNFGHTLGHAIESYFLTNTAKKKLLHGEAIAIGMILAAYISNKNTGLPKEELTEIKTVLLQTFNKVNFDEKDIKEIIELMKYDKKNSHGNINFVLLEKIGQPKIDCIVTNNLIYEAFAFYAE
ncbi:3-dehydroquinate synthase [Mesonia aestuariivivens]|uniref:3-dehydroquinate synthase n=1 Tax=Mesonia aestuariivivens TaxID=2796128 RepID=A0ABS6VYL3_9FLAO|nr:3-dehydroquinate synthase [Mesonia aestuariivivens]MBW2960682.1 3-dehydroquinate synthase [Mesonia aestuariivivens]